MARILVEAFDGLIGGRIVNIPAGTELTDAIGGAAVLAAGAATFEFEEDDRAEVETLVAAWRVISATRVGIKLISFVAQVGVGGAVVPTPWPLRIVGADFTVTADDLHGFIVVTDTGSPITGTFPAGLDQSFDTTVIYIAPSGASGELVTLSGPSTTVFLNGPSTLSAGMSVRALKLATSPGPTYVYLSTATVPVTYGNAGRFTPNLTASVDITLLGNALYTRAGQLANNGRPGALDIMTAFLGLQFTLLDTETFQVDITDLPAGLSNVDVRARCVPAFAKGTDTFTIAASRVDENTLRLTGSVASSGGSTGTVECDINWEAAS